MLSRIAKHTRVLAAASAVAFPLAKTAHCSQPVPNAGGSSSNERPDRWLLGRLLGVKREEKWQPHMREIYKLEQAIRSENSANPRTDTFLKMMQPLMMEIEEEEGKIKELQRLELRQHIITMQEGGSISIPKLLAAASRVVEIELGYSVRTVQLVAVLSFCQTDTTLRGSLAQVLAGEGKTLIIALLTLKLAVIDQRRVDVVTSNKSLAERDAKQFEKLAAWFQVSVGHITDTSDSALYSSQVVYSDCHQLQHDMLKCDLNAEDGRSGRRFDVVVADEVDNLFIDRLLHGTRIASPLCGGELFVPIWLAIFAGVDSGLEDEDIFQNVRGRIQREWPLPTSLRTFAEKNLQTWIENAHRAKEKLESDCDYIIQDGKVIIVDSGHTGQVMHGVHWSEGLMQMIQIKEQLAVSTESLSVAHASNLSFFRRYSTIYGLTGTLGTQAESQTLEQLYQVDSWRIPPHKPKKMELFAPQVASTHKDWFHQIVNGVQKQTSRKRAVLIVCEYIDDAKKVKAELELSKCCRSIIMYTRDDNEENAAPEQELKAGDVVVATNIGGRGTDFRVEQIVNEAGGLHVILTYLPLNSRVEDQAFGRTARSGSPGSGQIIVWNDTCLGHFGLLKMARYMHFVQRVARLSELVRPEERRSQLFQHFARLMQQQQEKMAQLAKDDKDRSGLISEQLVYCRAAALDIRHSWQLIFAEELGTSEQQFAELEARWRKFVEGNCNAAQAPFRHPSSLVRTGNAQSSHGQHEIAEKLYMRSLTLTGHDQEGDLALAAALVGGVANSIRAGGKLRTEEEAIKDLRRASELLERHWESWVRACGRAAALACSSADCTLDDIPPGCTLQHRLMQRVEVLEWFNRALEKVPEDLRRCSNPTVTFDAFPNHIDSAIQEEFKAVGLEGLLRITGFWDQWGPYVIIAFGFLEIFAAYVVIMPGLSTALAVHGVDDVICGIKAAWQGHFDIETYACQKLIKVFLTAFTAALNETVQPDEEAAATWTPHTLQEVGEKVAGDLLRELRDAGMEALLAEITPKCIEEWTIRLCSDFSSEYGVQKKLQKLLHSHPEFEQKLSIFLFNDENKAVLLRVARLGLESRRRSNEAGSIDIGWEDFQLAGIRFCLFQLASKDLSFDKSAKRWRDLSTERFEKDPLTFVEKWAPHARNLAEGSRQFVKYIAKPSEDIVADNFEVVRKHVDERVSETDFWKFYTDDLKSKGQMILWMKLQFDKGKVEEKRQQLVSQFVREWEEVLASELKASIRSSVLGAANKLTTQATSKIVDHAKDIARKESQKKKAAKSKSKKKRRESKT